MEENKNTSGEGTVIFGQPGWVVGLIILILLAVLGYMLWTSPTADSDMDTDDAVVMEEGTQAPVNTSGSAGSVVPQQPSRFFENGYYVNIVRFDGTKFIPSEITIDVGEAIRFVNTSTLSMRVGSRVENLSSTYYSNVDQPFDEESFEIRLSKVGTWAYENLPNAKGNRIFGVVNIR